MEDDARQRSAPRSGPRAEPATAVDVDAVDAAAPPLINLLREGFRWFNERLNERAAAEGDARISVSAAVVLSYLPAAGGRPKDVARAMGVSRQHVHTTLRELVTADVLELVPDPTSGRDRLIRVTAAGEDLRARNIARMRTLENELSAGLDADEIVELRRLLICLVDQRRG